MRAKFFGWLARLLCRMPGTIVLLGIGLAGAGVSLALNLQMHTSRVDLLSPHNPQIRNYNSFTREFGTANNVYFILESPSLAESKRSADALAAEISKHPSLIRDVLYRFDVEAVKGSLLLHLSPKELHRLDEYLDEESDLLKNLAGAENLNVAFSTMADLAEKRAREAFKNPATPLELAALASLLEWMNSYIWEGNDGGVGFLSSLIPGSLPLGISDDPEGYLVGENGRTVILLARPNAEKEDTIEFLKPMMASLVQAREKVLKEFPKVTIGMTGLPTFAYGDLRVMEDEIPLLSLVALGLVIALFFLFFHHPLEVAFATVAMLIAVACTLGTTRVLIGHLNIMSSVFAMTMVGLGIDFGVHFIGRFYDEKSNGGTFEEVMKRTLVGCGPPISTGALTTAAAFYLLFATDFRGLAELGVIAGTGILLSLISMFTILPSLISLRNKWGGSAGGSTSSTTPILARTLGRLAAAVEAHAGVIIAVAVAATLVMCYFAPRVRFDYNFLHIQPVTSTTAQYEGILMRRTGLAPSYDVVVKDDLQSLEETSDELAALPSVSRVDSASGLVPPDQEQRIRAARGVVERIAGIREEAGSAREATDLTKLVEQYREMQRGLETALKAKALVGNKRVISEIRRCARAGRRFLEKYDNAGAEALSPRLEAFSTSLFSYMEELLATLGSNRQLEKVSFADLPENIRTRFVGRTGKYAAYVFPSRSVWNKAFLDRFNADVTTIAPDATGSALFAQTMLDVAGRALRQCSLLVFGAIVVLMFLDFRKATPMLLALLSVVVGVIWMLGIMDLVGWRYNPINIMAVPLMLGIGIDNGVHIVHRFREGGCDVRKTLATSGRAIAVSSLTTIAGFACVLFSTHRGLISLGQLMVLGVGACLIASLTVLPAVLKSLSEAGIKI